jgi:ubiquinone/menaquinone biosynthesis C-methylase UbiE
MTDWQSWQRSWDVQQAAYMPDREERFTALLDTVEAAVGPKPRVLDLACGTGSISLRLLKRFPHATSVAVDLDPALLRIAEGTFDGEERVRFVSADLSESGWLDDLGEPFDAVLTATALHWLPERRVKSLYAEVYSVLNPGGVFSNADHMADPGLPGLTPKLDELRKASREAQYENGDALSWEAWWDAARRSPELAEAVAQRDTIFTIPHEGGSMPLVTSHLDFLREAGFSEVGLIWRGLSDAAFAAVR